MHLLSHNIDVRRELTQQNNRQLTAHVYYGCQVLHNLFSRPEMLEKGLVTLAKFLVCAESLYHLTAHGLHEITW